MTRCEYAFSYAVKIQAELTLSELVSVPSHAIGVSLTKDLCPGFKCGHSCKTLRSECSLRLQCEQIGTCRMLPSASLLPIGAKLGCFSHKLDHSITLFSYCKILLFTNISVSVLSFATASIAAIRCFHLLGSPHKIYIANLRFVINAPMAYRSADNYSARQI